MKKKIGGKLTEFYKDKELKRAHERVLLRRLQGTAMRPGNNEVEAFRIKKDKKS